MRRPTAEQSRLDTQAYRDALLATLSALPDVPLFLSGGMDSMSLLAGLVTLGRKPDCITYRLSDSYSADMAVAVRITRDLGVPHHQVTISEEPAQLRHDARRAVQFMGTRKTRVECAIPIWYLARYANRALGASQAVTGDPGIIEDLRAYAVAINANDGCDTAETRVMRLRGYGTPGPGSAAMREAALMYGVTLIGPYSLEPIASTVLGMHPYQVNYPRQKGIALRAFPDIFGKHPPYRYWKPNKSMQTASGLSERIAQAFDSEPRRMVGVYRAIEREVSALPKEVPWA